MSKLDYYKLNKNDKYKQIEDKNDLKCRKKRRAKYKDRKKEFNDISERIKNETENMTELEKIQHILNKD